jgi:hypothetical protein
VTAHADSTSGAEVGSTSRSGGTNPPAARTSSARRSSSSNVSSGGGPSSTVTTQSWHASPRTTHVSQSILVVMGRPSQPPPTVILGIACGAEIPASHGSWAQNGRVRAPSVRDLGIAAVVFGVALLVYAPTAATQVVSADVHSAATAAWRIAATGTPWMEDVDLAQLPGKGELTFIYPAVNGHLVVHRSPGVVAVLLPGAWLSGSTEDPNSLSLLPEAMTAALLTALSVSLMFCALRSRLSIRAALVASATFAFATPVWTVSANGTWTHTVTVLGIAGMAWAASSHRWLLVGLLGGVALWGRLHVAIIVAVLGLGVALARRSPRIALAVAGPSVALLALAGVWSRWMYGSWRPTGGYGGGTYVDQLGENGAWTKLVDQAGLWIAPDRGILVWTPILILLLPAVTRSWRSQPDWSRSLLVGGVLYTLVQGQLNGFSGGDAFYGYRLGLEFLAAATPAFALAWPSASPWVRRIAPLVVAAQAAAFSLGAVADSLFLPEARAWTDNAFAFALRTYPGAIAWLALFLLAGVLASGLSWRRDHQSTRTGEHTSDRALDRRPSGTGPA